MFNVLEDKLKNNWIAFEELISLFAYPRGSDEVFRRESHY